MGTDDLLDSPEIGPKPTAQRIAREQPVGFLTFTQKLADWARNNGWAAEFKQAKCGKLELEYTFSPDPLFQTEVCGPREYGALSITKLNEWLKGVEKTGWVYKLVSMRNGRLQCTFSRGGGITVPPVKQPQTKEPSPKTPPPEAVINIITRADDFFERLYQCGKSYGSYDKYNNSSQKEEIGALVDFVRGLSGGTNKTFTSNKEGFEAFYGVISEQCKKVEVDLKQEHMEALERWGQSGGVHPGGGPSLPVMPDEGDSWLKAIWNQIRIPEYTLGEEDVKKLGEALRKVNNVVAGVSELKTRIGEVLRTGMVPSKAGLEKLLQEVTTYLEKLASTPKSTKKSWWRLKWPLRQSIYKKMLFYFRL